MVKKREKLLKSAVRISRTFTRTLLITAVMFFLPAAAFCEECEDKEKSEPVHISGCIEAEYSDTEISKVEGESANESGIAIATVCLEMEWAWDEWAECYISGIYEENETEPAELDEAVITFPTETEWSFFFGQTYLPWGKFNSCMLTDPMVLELGELRYIQGGFEYAWDEVTLHTALFRGPGSGGGLSAIDFTTSLEGQVPEYYTWVVGYISDMTGGEGFEAASEEASRGNIAGLQLYGDVSVDDWIFKGEFIGALESASSEWLDADSDGSGDTPMAAYVEVERTFDEDWSAGVRYEKSWEFAGAPSTRWGIAVLRDLGSGFTAGAEYIADDFIPAWTDDDFSSARTVTVRFGYEF